MKEVRNIDGSSGVSPLGPSNKVKAALRKAFKKINNSPRTEMAGLERLFKSKFGIPSESLLFANALKELIYLVPAVLKPARALIVGPAPDIYEDAALSAGAEVSYVSAPEADGFVFDVSGLKEAARDNDVVFLSNPNRVTGRLAPGYLAREISSSGLCESTHFVIDETLMDFACPGGCLDDIIHDNITVLRTTANYYGVPGLELAYALSSPGTIRAYEEKTHWEVNLLSIEAARAAYKDPAYSKAIRRYIPAEKNTLLRMLRKIDWLGVYETDTNIFLVKIKRDPEGVALKLKRAGLDISDCGDIKGLDRSFLRISVMKHENNLKLISVLKGLDQRGTQ